MFAQYFAKLYTAEHVYKCFFFQVCPWVRRQASGVGRHLDCDGLASLTDPVQSRLAQLAADNQQAELEYQCRIQQLEAQLRHAKTLLYQYSSGKNGAGKLLEPRDETVSVMGIQVPYCIFFCTRAF